MRIFAPQHTQIPNELIDDWLKDLTFVQLKVLMAIMRKTFGWHKVRDRISLTQLEEITGANRQAILKSSKELEKMGLIRKVVSGSKGTQQTHYELVVEENSNNFYQYDRHTPPQCDEHTPPSVMNTPTKETLTKEKISPIVPKRDFINSPKSSLKTKKIAKEKKEVAKFVKVNETQYQDLLEKSGSIEKLQQCFDFLSKWKIGKGLEDMPNDYASINRWVISAVDKENSKPKSVDRSEEDKKIASFVCERFKNNRDICIGRDYIEFNFGPGNYSHTKFGDHNFKEIVQNNLRKMNLKVSL